ncbi:MAG: hypothetical protein IJN11_03215 [Oscillospiraceae bacterium]|nr:hypothetical protein [Oscillospiraceae bacterium]
MKDTLYQLLNHDVSELPTAEPLSDQEVMNIMKHFKEEKHTSSVKMKRKIKLSVVLLAASITIASIGTAVIAYANLTSAPVYYDKEMTQIVPHTHVDYEVNENGQTYGKNMESPYIEDIPDLIAVVGDHGKRGYVYRDELIGMPPSSPEEAEALHKSLENGTYTPKVYNVYEADGVTIIDTFTETVHDEYKHLCE